MIMKQSLRIMTVALFALMTSQVSAQSLYRAKSLISQGKYIEGAKELRPLADGGNAEAQYLAALLFMEGKGVNKSEEQAIKYANMSATQGSKDGIMLLYKIYQERSEYVNAFTVLKSATDNHPYMLKGEVGRELAICYIEGRGTYKNTEKAWQIMNDNEYLENFRGIYPEPVKRQSSQATNTNVRPKTINLPDEKYTKVRIKVYKADDDEVQAVEMKGDRTYVRIKYTNRRPWEYIFCQNHYIVCQGQKYYVNGSSLSKRRYVKPNEVVYYTNSYPRLPADATSFDYVDDYGRTTKTITFK